MSGDNHFQYIPNPVGWIDPFGLAFKPVIFPPNQVIHDVTIKMQGGRGRDFKAANEAAQINGKRGIPTQGSHKHVHGEVTWHHDDYNPLTNEARMQLVTTVDHEARIPHSGSVSEYEKAHGVTYESKDAKDLADKLNSPCP